MIKSMTGYGKAEVEAEYFIIHVEIRTLNSRYRDIILRIPQDLFPLEAEIRSLISKRLARGRIEVYIKFEPIPGKTAYEIILNEAVAKAYMNIFKELSETLSIDPTVTVDTFCHLRDVIIQKPKEIEIESLKEKVFSAISSALDSVERMRRQEGMVIEKDFLDRLDLIEKRILQIKERAPALISEYKEKLKENLRRLVNGEVQLDEERLNQEVALFAERSDITEELVRLESHILQFRKYLEKDEPVGRRLDFLIQEMTRETNTIGAKSQDKEISLLVVELKGEIEKLREQVQNVE